ncbi:hypothetical protein J2T13_001955 [Paenibacillus sp. DS2015]|uniref:prenylated flavin chaperone LpdD n=1 Tax=Paenibacillus sp. DS2015 TaxID=3373917 RepID=UPI003D23948D
MQLYNPGDITLVEVPVGRDTLLIITGGVAHIGAVATAYVGTEGIEVQTSRVPAHEEHRLVEKCARIAATALGRTVTVAAGIHYDDITKEQINAVVSSVDNLMEEYLQRVLNA